MHTFVSVFLDITLLEAELLGVFNEGIGNCWLSKLFSHRLKCTWFLQAISICIITINEYKLCTKLTK